MNDTVDVSGSTHPRYIVVEGPVGVGKTSLATRLAESFDSDLILEQPGDNPFLERFYRNRQSAKMCTGSALLFAVLEGIAP